MTISPPRRRWPAAATALVLLLGAAPAQHNDVERRNPDHLWLEAVGHPNGNSFPDVRQNPPAHRLPAGGVAPGTLSYAWIPHHANDFGADEIIDGFRAPLGPSSATAAYPANLYYPEVAVHRTRTVGGHVEPDVTAAPYYVLPEAPLVFPAFGYYESGTNLLTSYTLPAQQREVVISLKWNRTDSRWKPDTLNMWGDAYANVYDQPVFGFVTPSGTVTPVPMTGPQPGHLSLTYRRSDPSVQVRSDWGRAYLPPSQFPGLFGTSISTYQAPLASAGGMIGWDLVAGPTHAGATGIPLLNVGAPPATATPFAGLLLELDVTDPAIATLAGAGYFLALDSSGFARGPLVPVPKLGASAIGTAIGVEYLILDAAGAMLTASSQAGWVFVR